MTATLMRSTTPLTESAILAAFTAEGMRPSRWTSAAGDVFDVHCHAYHKVLYCVRGSITFTLPGSGDVFELFPGDRLDIEAGTQHSAVVGAEGVTCVEAARP